MKKVLQISKYYYPYIGGIEQVARDVANALKDEDIEQKIICFNEDVKDDNGDILCRKSENTTDVIDGIEVIRCGYQVKVASQSISLSYGKQLKKVMDEFQPDIVIFHYPNPFVARLLLKYKKRKFNLYIYWHLDIIKQKLLKKFFGAQNKQLIKRADKIIGTSEKYLKESECSKFFDRKEIAIPLKIDEKRVQLTEKDEELGKEIREKYKGKVIAFFIGRHVPYKGLEYLIDASKYLQSNIKIIIAGSGELTEKLHQRAKGDEKIEFVGRVSDSELRAYLYACDIFCFPSITKNEAFGISLAEAMYYGKPAVTFTIPGSGVNYVSLGGVTGIECPNRDDRAYAEAMQKLADDEGLRNRYGQNARKRAKELFGADRFKQDIINIITKD
ncbi:MAG: glycosyltransferase [Eubacterium sp.]